ncbi:ribosomal protein l22p/L17e domain-containing protein [Ditylenchus destructor]|uniref:Large ribosomal subunit protein uL22m n=1 Tax=Ditylenchus destructor TaxID=166010 RepID=A0AAD4NGQ6_9BILA|nr:ribosomal protein l22p/L17e domain-containing protein [Ditylenchus destructor]
MSTGTRVLSNLKVATLNCWALPYPWPIGSQHRTLRIEKLIEALADSPYHIVALQELWCEKDFLLIAHRLKDKFPYCHYFHRYSLNGFAHHIHRGDWFGGKIAGFCEVAIGNLRAAIYTTHPHRISQCFELAQFVRHTSRGSDFVVLMGDLVINIAQLSDAWECRPKSDSEEPCAGMTSERPDNIFTSQMLWDRRIFLALCFILLAIIIATVNIESSFPYLTVLIAVIRFVLSLLIGFSLWHGFVGLTIEMKALKETKYSVSGAFESTLPSGSEKKNLPNVVKPLSQEEIWDRRQKLSRPSIQRFEKPAPKIYYAPEWKIDQSKENETYSPLYQYGTTPEKWEYYNKVVWPKNHVVPETGLRKAAEVFHCRESVHIYPKRIWNACYFVRRMKVKEALLQLGIMERKTGLLLAEVIREAVERAKNEFHIENPEDGMFIAEAFAIQCNIIKGRRRHARNRWCPMRYRYCNIFIRLEEGEPPHYTGRAPKPTGWEHMEEYYKYLRLCHIRGRLVVNIGVIGLVEKLLGFVKLPLEIFGLLSILPINIEPNDLGYHLVINIAQLSDAWECRPKSGVTATFFFKEDPPSETNSEKMRHIATERLFLEKSLRILEEGEVSGAFESTLPSGSEKKNLPNVVKPLSQEEIWDRRQKLSRPSIQRFEKPAPKIYYAPEWKIDQSKENETYSPLYQYGTTPEKWEYYNKVVWPKNHVVPETGLRKAAEVFHCRESVHIYPKRIWNACYFVRRMKVKEALLQLGIMERKTGLLLAEVIREAVERAKNEFHIENPEDGMFIAEAFAIQCNIIKGRRRHARNRWCPMRYRYCNIFIRLEEGEPPHYTGRAPKPTGWEHMEEYYKYLRNRDIKYSI